MIPRSSKPLKRTPVKRSNPKRRASEFKRCYGSKARVEFVKSLPCAACGVVGYSENAHLLGNGGMSRKADADTIGPLCAAHPDPRVAPWPRVMGCHQYFDEYRDGFNKKFPNFDAEKVARETEELWASSVLEDTK